jgi:hypothetical protein
LERDAVESAIFEAVNLLKGGNAWGSVNSRAARPVGKHMNRLVLLNPWKPEQTRCYLSRKAEDYVNEDLCLDNQAAFQH